MRWFIPDDQQRVRSRAAAVRRDAAPAAPAPRRVLHHRGRAGGALWVPPGARNADARAAGPAAPGDDARVRPRESRAQRGLAVMDSGHPRKPHYYLDTLGVAPECQGRGLGSALMQPMLERCDRERMPAYLNAGSWRSRDLYLRHGFQVRRSSTSRGRASAVADVARAAGLGRYQASRSWRPSHRDGLRSTPRLKGVPSSGRASNPRGPEARAITFASGSPGIGLNASRDIRRVRGPQGPLERGNHWRPSGAGGKSATAVAGAQP